MQPKTRKVLKLDPSAGSLPFLSSWSYERRWIQKNRPPSLTKRKRAARPFGERTARFEL